MTKQEMFALGFIEEDGWLVFPKFRKYCESGRIFMLGTTKEFCRESHPHLKYFGFEELTLVEVLHILLDTAITIGHKSGSKTEKENFKNEMQRLIARVT